MNNNQNGSVMVIALMLMALLTLLGVSAINSATIEIQIAGNERSYKQNFYKAEAAAIEAIQIIQNSNKSQLEAGLIKGIIKDVKMTKNSNWNDSNNYLTSKIDSNSYYSIVYEGFKPGSPPLTQALHYFLIYGCYRGSGGVVLIETGYRKRLDINNPIPVSSTGNENYGIMANNIGNKEGIYFWREVNE